MQSDGRRCPVRDFAEICGLRLSLAVLSAAGLILDAAIFLMSSAGKEKASRHLRKTEPGSVFARDL